MAARLLCQECADSDQRSRVDLVSTVVTEWPVAIFWDEDGKKHGHNPNLLTETFRCSNGHEWQSVGFGRCANCDWEAPHG